MRILLVVGLSAAAALYAQPRVQARLAPAAAPADPVPSLSLPVMGLIAGDGPAEVRALVGLPGSATAGDALAMPEGVRRVHLAPGQATALVERMGAPVGVLAFDAASAGAVSEIAGAMTRVDLAGFSPSGAYAVLHSLQGSRIQVIALNGATGRVLREFTVAGLAPIHQVTIDDAGEVPVAITDDGGVYLVGNAAPKLVFRGATITDAGFIAGVPALLVADAQARQVTLIDHLPDLPAPRVVGMGMENDGQLWVRSSTDGKTAFAAGSGRRTVWRIGITSGDTRSVELPEDTTGLARLGSGNTFVFSAAAGGPVWLLLGDDPDLRAVFVPGSGTGVKRGPTRR